MNQQQNSISNNAILSALAGILFFGPLIKGKSKNHTETEQQFIQGYCKAWTINIGLFAIILVAFVLNYFLSSIIITRIINIACGSICGISIISIFACINEIQLFEANEKETTDIPRKGTVAKSFIPLYNIVLRYQSPNLQTPYRWLKESTLRRILFSFSTMLFGATVGIIIIAAISIRLSLLLINIDMIPNNLKKVLNQSFLIHPEEIVGYLIGRIKATAKKSDPNEEIILAKQAYSENKASSINTLLQYLSFIGILTMLHKNLEITYTMGILGLAIMIRGGRSLLSYRTYKKRPNIPILYEIRSLIVK